MVSRRAGARSPLYFDVGCPIRARHDPRRWLDGRDTLRTHDGIACEAPPTFGIDRTTPFDALPALTTASQLGAIYDSWPNVDLDIRLDLGTRLGLHHRFDFSESLDRCCRIGRWLCLRIQQRVQVHFVPAIDIRFRVRVEREIRSAVKVDRHIEIVTDLDVVHLTNDIVGRLGVDVFRLGVANLRLLGLVDFRVTIVIARIIAHARRRIGKASSGRATESHEYAYSEPQKSVQHCFPGSRAARLYRRA